MPRPERDFADVYAAIDAEHSDAALEKSPTRCPVTPEISSLRHLLYRRKPHVYRIIYPIVERRSEVEINHIRHGAWDKFLV